MNNLLITFEVFWCKYHYVLNIPKPGNKNRAEIEWNRCNFSHLKAKAIEDIHLHKQSDLTALEYLRLIFNDYENKP